MSLNDTERALVGLNAAHLMAYGRTRLLPEVCTALHELTRSARAAGFELCVASGFRDFERQLMIWNGKLCGERPVLDDQDRAVPMDGLGPHEQLHCVMRFSALPGASRHHWGSDLDVFDAAAVPEGYELQLSQAEVAPAGVFGPFHAWLDERIASGEGCGFYRPYGTDRRGVATERWHLSYAPLARTFQRQLTPALVRRAWQEAVPNGALAHRTLLEESLEVLLERYVQNVDEPTESALGYTP